MTGAASPRTGVRLAELVAVLSLGADLGMGQPMEHAMRQCLIALRLGERLGLGVTERASLYYVSLIAWVGCHIDAYEQAKWFGDDLALKRDSRLQDMTGLTPLAFIVSHLGAGRPPLQRARIGVGFVAGGHREVDEMLANHWYAADALAEHLGLGDDVRATLSQTFERWDGRGAPRGCKGDEILLAARIVNLADVAEVFHRVAGRAGAVAVAHERSGSQFCPELVATMAAEAPTLFRDLDGVTTWDTVIAAEPGLARMLREDELDSALEAIADFIDIKSPFTLGHSRGVADLAAAAAELRLGPAASAHVRRAALVHDLGRLGVSNGVWDKAGELTTSEVERVRLHPYLTDRMLAACPGLAALGATAVQHHERLDGSGYPRGLHADALTPCGRVLAAADAYQTKLEPRPYRPARSPDEAAAWLRHEAGAGHLAEDGRPSRPARLLEDRGLEPCPCEPVRGHARIDGRTGEDGVIARCRPQGRRNTVEKPPARRSERCSSPNSMAARRSSSPPPHPTSSTCSSTSTGCPNGTPTSIT